MQLPSNVSKLVWQFMSGNFLSKVSGLVRDVTMAFYFGADAIVAAFIVAYRMANLLRRLFGEGALIAGFVPHFESLKVESEAAAFRFFKKVAFSMASILLILIVLFELIVGSLHYLKIVSKDTLFILDMTALMFPSILFICLYGIFSGVLQSYKKFFQTSIAPVIFNFSWIVVMLCSKHLDKKTAMVFLSAGVLFGFVAQFLFTAWQVRNIRLNIDFSKDSEEVLDKLSLKPIFSSLIAGVVGVGATQINNACDVLFSRSASLEGPAYLTYGIRIQQLPLSVFVIALSSVILPQLSRLAKLDQKEEFFKTMQNALHRTFFILLPITFMCFVLGGTFVNSIYGRGGFDQKATIETTYSLWAYSLGLIPMGFVVLLAPAFYAQKDYRTTTLASVFSVLSNLLLNAVFINFLDMGSVSVAFATSLASFVNMFILFRFLKIKFEFHLHAHSIKEFAKIFLASAFAFSAVFALEFFVFHTPSSRLLANQAALFPRDVFTQLWQLICGVTSYITSYLTFCFLLKVEGVSFHRIRKLLAN